MAIESIRKFLKNGKRPNNSAQRTTLNRKVQLFDDFLQIHVRKLAKAHGGRPNATLVELVGKASGKTLSYLDAWEWLIDDYAADPAREPWDWHDYVVSELKRGIQRVKVEEAEKREAYIVRQAQLAAQQIPGTEFYQSLAWRELRYKVLKKASGACEACRRTTHQHSIVLHVDHILPRSQFPALALEETNLQVLCEDCNIGKGTKDQTDWRPLDHE